MTEAYICDSVRTPIGRYGGALAHVRADDLAAIPIRALIDRNPDVDWAELDDVILGCANQAGEDNRNLARMAGLLAGLPDSSGGVTLNRLCGSGLDAVAMAARAIRGGEADLIIAGGCESMSRAPFVMAKATSAFDRNAEMYDTTIGWRFVNPKMKRRLWRRHHAEHRRECRAGVPGQPRGPGRVRAAQPGEGRRRRRPTAGSPRRSSRSRSRSARAIRSSSTRDEHPRATTLEALAQAEADRPHRTARVTAGNASGVNDGAAAIIIATEEAAKRNGLTPRARVLGAAVAGVPPRIMGIGPAPATEKLMKRLGLKIGDFDVIELNEAFAAQGLAVLRQLGLADDDAAREPQRRRDRARPSARHVGRAPRADRDRGAAAHRRQARARHHVHRRRPGNRARARTGVDRAMGGVRTDDRRGGDHGRARNACPIRKSRCCRSLDLGIVRGIAEDPPRVLITPTYTGCPATIAIEESDPRRARRRRLRRRVHRARSCSRRGPPTGSRERGRERLKAYGIAPPTTRRPPNARNAARPTPRRSAASARPRARRNGAANPAWSRSTASNATRLFGAELPGLLAISRGHVALEIHFADRLRRSRRSRRGSHRDSVWPARLFWNATTSRMSAMLSRSA